MTGEAPRQKGGAGATPDIAIIGTGFSGLCMAMQLKRAGIHTFTLFEKAGRLGGTWRDNTYPGAGCDIPSHLYSFSFAPKYDWSRKFPGQAEILQYLEDCAESYDLELHIRFNSEVISATFDDDRSKWLLETRDGESLEVDVLVSGCGQLNEPQFPNIPGRESFAGMQFHSARWNHDHDLSGRRVAAIGTGASAIQYVPRIAPEVERLHLFQRTPPWIVSKPDREYRKLEKLLFQYAPWVRELHRRSIYWMFESRFLAFGKNSRIGRFYEKLLNWKRKREVNQTDLQEKLAPNYPAGCKRILLSNEYYDALQRDNVELVTSPIKCITPEGIVTRDGGTHEVDTIIYGTGFASQRFLSPMRVTGIGGKRLEDIWQDGAEAYLGVTVAGFPNFFMLYGPNTNLGHNSIIVMIESQVNYVMQCIQALIERNLRCLDVRPEVMQTYNRKLQDELSNTVWDAGCESWYKTDSGKIVNNWSGSTLRYRWMMGRLNLENYRVIE